MSTPFRTHSLITLIIRKKKSTKKSTEKKIGWPMCRARHLNTRVNEVVSSMAPNLLYWYKKITPKNINSII